MSAYLLPADRKARIEARKARQKPGRPLVMAACDREGQWVVIDRGCPILETVYWPSWRTALRDAQQIVEERWARETHSAALAP